MSKLGRNLPTTATRPSFTKDISTLSRLQRNKQRYGRTLISSDLTDDPRLVGGSSIVDNGNQTYDVTLPVNSRIIIIGDTIPFTEYETEFSYYVKSGSDVSSCEFRIQRNGPDFITYDSEPVLNVSDFTKVIMRTDPMTQPTDASTDTRLFTIRHGSVGTETLVITIEGLRSRQVK